jgi:hypothetical protein
MGLRPMIPVNGTKSLPDDGPSGHEAEDSAGTHTPLVASAAVASVGALVEMRSFDLVSDHFQLYPVCPKCRKKSQLPKHLNR